MPKKRKKSKKKKIISRRIKIKKKTKKKIKKVKKFRKKKSKKRFKKKRRIKKRAKKLTKKIRKRLSKVKFRKTKIAKFNNQINQLKKLTFQKVINFIVHPIFKAYEDYREHRRIQKLKKDSLEKKQREKQVREGAKLRKQLKEQELRDEIKFARERSKDLKNFIRLEQAILRKEQTEKKRHFLQELKLQKRIDSFRHREQLEIKNLEKLALQSQIEDYRLIQERIEKIKGKYRLIREQKIRERVQSLGLEVLSSDTKEDLLQKEKEHEQQRQNIEIVLESFYRSANSLIFQLNKRYIPKHKSILRLIDFRYETGECFIKYDDSPNEEWLILIYLEDSNPLKRTIIIENKSNPEKYETKSFETKEIFNFSDYLVDVMTSHIDRERKKQKTN